MARGARERLLPAREARLDQRGEAGAHEVAREGLVGVAFILDPLQTALPRVLREGFSRNVEQRPREDLVPESRARLHAARAAQARAAQQVPEHGLGLVVEVV